MQKPDFMYLKNLTVPIVLLDTYCDFPNVDCVMINNMQGAFNATVRLIHKHIGQPGYLHSSYPIHSFEERCEGFTAHCAKTDFRLPNRLSTCSHLP